jgi:hypothetical protein
MSLISMGWGHLTVITFGLGNGILDFGERRRKPRGVVAFTDMEEDEDFKDTTPEGKFVKSGDGVDFRQRKREVEFE